MSKGFLELGLKPGESLRIGDDVSVTVVRIDAHGKSPTVELGISAPKQVQVKREEIYNRINGIDERVRRFPVRKQNQARKQARKPVVAQASPLPPAATEKPITGYVAGAAVSTPKAAKITVKKSRKVSLS